jgi:hypothetical protein
VVTFEDRVGDSVNDKVAEVEEVRRRVCVFDIENDIEDVGENEIEDGVHDVLPLKVDDNV